MCPTNPPNVPKHKKIKIKTGSHPLFSPLNPVLDFDPRFANFMKSRKQDEILIKVVKLIVTFHLHFSSTNVGRRSVVYEETAPNPENASTHESSLCSCAVVSSLNPKTRASKQASTRCCCGVCVYVCARVHFALRLFSFCVCGSDSGVQDKAAMEDAEVQAEGALSAPALASTQGRFSL
jgi:hypothetical protein